MLQKKIQVYDRQDGGQLSNADLPPELAAAVATKRPREKVTHPQAGFQMQENSCFAEHLVAVG